MLRMLDKLRLRLASLFRGSQADASLKGEILVHLQEQIDENIASGMSPADARAAALRTFGPVALIEEQCRDTRRVAFVEHVVQDMRYTLRSLVRQPMLLLAAVVSIAVAVGANTTIFSLANELMFAMPSAERPDQLVHIQMGGGSHVSHLQWRQLEESGALGGLTGFNVEVSVNWQGPEQSISLNPMVVAANFFDVVGPPMQPRAGLHGGGSAGRARSHGRCGQLRFLAAPPGRRSRRSWQDAHVQRPALHRSRRGCRRRTVDGRVRAGAGGLSADRSCGDA